MLGTEKIFIMHHNEDKETSSFGVESANGIKDGTLQSPSKEGMMPKDNDESFACAINLSGILDSSQISTSSGDSNSSSSSYRYSSSSTSTDCSSSIHSNSSSDKAGGEAKVRVDKNKAVCEGSPVFATCSTFSSSSSTASVSTVRRSESWGALRSASLDSSKGVGSDKVNATAGDFRNSVSSMKEHNIESQESHPETYYTPSNSMHSITFNRNGADSQSMEGVEMNGDMLQMIQAGDLDLTDENKDLDNASNIEFLESVETLQSKPSMSSSMEEEDTDKADKVDENKLFGVLETMGIDIDELASVSSESNASKDGSFVISPTTKELIKAAKLARKPAKKRMWYQQIFSASYKSRSGDFKKLFKELPIKERLLVDYSCALQKEILVQGRMYVSQGYLSFHANIFGWETQTSLRLRDITSITKEKTALVIPNAIQVAIDGGDKLFFTSFVTRDATYLMLFKLWQNALLEDGMPSKEIQRLIHSSYGEELIITSDDEIDENLSCKSVVIGDLTDVSNVISELEASKSVVIDLKSKTSEIGPAIVVTGNLSSSIAVAAPKIKGQEHQHDISRVGLEPSDLSESSDSDEEFQAAEGMEELDSMEIPLCPFSHVEGRETINTIIPCNIDQLFTMLFTTSKFYLDFHTSRKTFNIHQAPWEFGKDGKKTRQVSLTVSLNAVMGPKHSQITDTQIMDALSKPGLFYAIDCESVNAGVPYADTFYVAVHFCLSRVSSVETKLAVVAQIKYKKSVWGITKSIIEKNAWAGIEEFYSHLERALKEECTKMILGGSPVPSPKHSLTGGPRRRLPRNRIKGKAPDIPIGVAPANRVTSRTGIVISDPVLTVPDVLAETPSSDSSLFLKVILCVLMGLLLLNAFLYFKLVHLETTTSSSHLFPPPLFTLTGEMPQNHQDWLLLLQKQEALHRIELQKWHEILMSALKILQQAESDLEALKFHINSYSGGKSSVEIAMKPSTDTDPVGHQLNLNLKSDEFVTSDDNKEF